MNADQFRLPDQREAARYLAAGEGHVRLVTMAPELPGGEPLVAYLAAQGIAVSIGHSDATFEETIRAVQLGATHTTHHFNGMRPLHHREPGVAGAGLMLPSLTTELIADGIHIHPAVVKLLYEIKGASQVCLITDAVRWAGLPDGTYGPYQVADGRVYIEGSDTLAGSSLTTLQALKNVMSFTGLPLEKVLPSFTMVPARQSGCSRIKGSLSSGKHADFLILDEDLTLLSTFVQGCKVYRKFE